MKKQVLLAACLLLVGCADPAPTSPDAPGAAQSGPQRIEFAEFALQVPGAWETQKSPSPETPTLLLQSTQGEQSMAVFEMALTGNTSGLSAEGANDMFKLTMAATAQEDGTGEVSYPKALAAAPIGNSTGFVGSYEYKGKDGKLRTGEAAMVSLGNSKVLLIMSTAVDTPLPAAEFSQLLASFSAKTPVTTAAASSPAAEAPNEAAPEAPAAE